jgi:hypothetical protein
MMLWSLVVFSQLIALSEFDVGEIASELVKI